MMIDRVSNLKYNNGIRFETRGDQMTLRDFRRSYGLTQEEFAEKIGVSRITIARLETGAHVTLNTLVAISDAFGITLDETHELFSGDRERRATQT